MKHGRERRPHQRHPPRQLRCASLLGTRPSNGSQRRAAMPVISESSMRIQFKVQFSSVEGSRREPRRHPSMGTPKGCFGADDKVVLASTAEAAKPMPAKDSTGAQPPRTPLDTRSSRTQLELSLCSDSEYLYTGNYSEYEYSGFAMLLGIASSKTPSAAACQWPTSFSAA